MLLFQLQDRALRATLDRLRHVASQTTGAVRYNVQRYLLKVQAAAQKLTPADADVSLRRSAQTDVDFAGANGLRGTITFGGLAEAYAEVQHENEDFAHTEAAWSAKYHRPFPDRRLTVRKYTDEVTGSSRKGVLTIRVRRFKEPGRRKRAHRITGYTGGQAHFLHGAPDSAWDSAGHARAKLESLLEDNLHQLFEAAVSKGGAD